MKYITTVVTLRWNDPNLMMIRSIRTKVVQYSSMSSSDSLLPVMKEVLNLVGITNKDEEYGAHTLQNLQSDCLCFLINQFVFSLHPNDIYID